MPALPSPGPPTLYSRIGNLAFAAIVSLFALLAIVTSGTVGACMMMARLLV